MWYITTGGEPQGPMDDAAFDRLIAGGTLPATTLAWKEGMAEWQPLGQVRALPASPAQASSTCTMCGKNVGADNLIDLLGHRVCAACKPQLVQSLREGAVPAGANATTAWREDKKVVTRDGTTLPPRCVKCNCPVDGEPLKRKVYWHSPLYYLLIFIGVLIYVIIAIFVRKWAVVHVYLCPAHQKRRKLFIAGAWLGVILAIFTFFGGAIFNANWLMGVAPLIFLGSLIAGLAGGRLVQPTRIKDKTVWLRGAGKDFLASLPDFPGS